MAVAVTSSERRGRLEDAFDASAGLANNPTSLRACLRGKEQFARNAISGGSLREARTGGFSGHNAVFAPYGPGEITPTEVVELYRDLVDDFDRAFMWLTNCANAGLDAFITEFNLFPNNTAPVGNPVVLDSSGRWNQLCTQFGIASNEVIGLAVNDISVFLWMMFHEVPALEARSDYTQQRVAEGAQFT